mmetsp:Transcript_56714/g.130403  ORF Transcript_56714/g.130403 Transcript_56714/m.130403 type:complete len:119 (+) Transcript_56714:67-423(+)
MASYGAIQHATTTKIAEEKDSAAMFARISGVVHGVAWIGLGASLIWYSTTIAGTCSASDLHTVYLAIGIADCIVGGLALISAANAKGPAEFLQHIKLQAKYQQEQRAEEAQREMEEAP